MSDNREQSWRNLSRESSAVRDAVHGDIWISDLERSLVNSGNFQKLRHIRQLGPAYLVYPSANHTRFEHCLGALYMAQKIIDSVKRNYEVFGTILEAYNQELAEGLSVFNLDWRDVVLIRIVALLHDAAHIPFGHILEKEGNIFHLTQWADKKRTEDFFNEETQAIISSDLMLAGVSKGEINGFTKELKECLCAIEGVDPKSGIPIHDEEKVPEDSAIGNLAHPYVGDIVGNTICADLLDYLSRDSYFTGLKLSTEYGLIGNFVVVGQKKDGARLVLHLARNRVIRLDLIDAAVELIRQRYVLAERVHYHGVKTAASAMINAAVYAYLRRFPDKDKKISAIQNLGDDELIYKLLTVNETQDDKSPLTQYDRSIVANIASKLRRRNLYKPVYELYSRRGVRDTTRIDQIIGRFADPQERYYVQKCVEELMKLSPGSVILYVTKKNLGKIARVRFLWLDGSVRPLDEISKSCSDILKNELDNLHREYEELWKLYMFVDADQKTQYGGDISSFCRKQFFPINDIEDVELSEATPLGIGELLEKYYSAEMLSLPPDGKGVLLEKARQLKWNWEKTCDLISDLTESYKKMATTRV